MAGAGEVRVTDPNTGGQKGSKPERFDLIPVDALEELARAYGQGTTKYAARNWERGYAWGLSFAALMRHAWAWWRGEETDPETGLSHMIHVAWHAFALYVYRRRGVGTDDRALLGGVHNERASTPRVHEAIADATDPRLTAPPRQA